MKLYLQKFALVAVLLFLITSPAYSQHHPLPTKAGQPLNKCIGCPGTNASGEDNEGLPVWPYSDPLVKHVGRLVDSVTTRDIQQPFRTVRGRKMLIAPAQHGSAPPRIYYQLGSAIGVYSLDQFFTQTVPSGMVTITSLTGAKRTEPEKVVKWEGFLYPEYAGSGWRTMFMDGQDRLSDFDYDDRGYVYAATGQFGWGIVKDDGRTTGGHLPFVSQLMGDTDPAGFSPSVVISVRTGSQYWAVTSGSGARAVYDVTTPAAPRFRRILTESANAVAAWAKAEDTERIAVVNGEGKVDIYSYDDFVGGGAPLATFSSSSGRFEDVSANPDGTFWAVSPGIIHRFSASGSTYSTETFAVPSFEARKVNYRDNYLVAVGKAPADGKMQIELRVYKIESGRPVEIDLGGFFTKFYHRAPQGYGQPRASEVSTIFGGHVIKYGGKTYLVYNAGGLADAFELQTGDSISASRRNRLFGSINPYSQSTEAGPFYGDTLGFTSTDTNPLSDFFVDWNFANPESGTANVLQSQTNRNVEHQFTGLATANAISATKNVKVVAASDSEMSATVPVNMMVPVARIGIADSTLAVTTTVVTDNGAQLSLVLGDKLTDASDGTVEGHYSEWTVDGVTTKGLPNAPVDAGAYGSHTATLVANYGQYDPSSFAMVGSPFQQKVQNLAYEIRPFVAEFRQASRSGSTVTFKAAARKSTSVTIGTWDVVWTLQTPSTSDVDPTSTVTTDFGTIPNFDVTTAIPDGSILTLTVSVPATSLPAEAANFASQTITQTLNVPAPQIQISGCAETGDPCSFSVPNAASDWNLAWTLKSGATTVKTSSANPFVYTIDNPANYTISVVASTGVFDSPAVSQAFEVTEPACGNPPATSMIAIATSCDTCDTNVDVSMSPSILGYNWQGCEEFEWKFGDGSATLLTTTFTVKHKYTTSGKKTISLRVKKGTEYSGSVSYQINVGSVVEPPPPPVCTLPTGIQVTYSGSKGCGPGTPCKTGEQVTFTARRGSSSLQSCDTLLWTLDDNSTSASKPSVKRTYSTPGSYTVQVIVSNINGAANAVGVTVPVVLDGGTGGSCDAPATSAQVYAEYTGPQSGCNDLSPSTVCRANEPITFSARPFAGYTIQSCDTFEWDFGDGSALMTGLDVTHAYAGGAPSYRVKLRIFNSKNTTGNSITMDVPFSTAPAKPVPVLSFVAFPTAGTKGNAVTFTVNANIPATGWTWDFGDNKKDSTQTSVVGTTTSITHTYAANGTYNVSVKARNAEDVTSAPTNSAVGTIKIDDIPEFKYLLPVTAHSAGQGSSVWRTDVQIYNPDPNVSATNPLEMTALFQDNTTTLKIEQSTYSYEDFLARLTTAEAASGPVIITTKAKYAPQIWTRTYNQTDNGTFGQFIPAIRLDAAGGGSGVGDGRYFLAGLRNDARYRTNIGLVNPTALRLTATIRVYDEGGLPIENGTFTRTLEPFQLDQFPIGSVIPNFPVDRNFSLEVEVAAGQWVIPYASFIDGGSNDPIFLQGIRESELVSEDYRTTVIPGVGHIGAWRSDVTIYNSNGRAITVDLAYHDQTGAKVGEAHNVPIGGGEFLQYGDLLKQGILGGSVPDSLGMLRISVPAAVSTDRFPMTFARTYNDNGSGKTYGQGIAGFAGARANVKATAGGLIPAVRSQAGQYYTNVFVTNVTDAPVSFSITVLDPNTGVEGAPEVHDLAPYQSYTATRFNIGEGRQTASLKIQATGSVWAYASIVDERTFDPEYVPATPLAPIVP